MLCFILISEVNNYRCEKLSGVITMLMSMRRKSSLKCYFGLAFGFLLIFYFIIYEKLPDTSSRSPYSVEDRQGVVVKFHGPLTKDNLPERLTVIIREFEDYENLLSKTVDLIHKGLGQVPVFIVADKLPYPPVKLMSSDKAKIITLSSDLQKNYSSGCPLHFIDTQYVLIIPDAVKIRDWKQIQSFVSFLRSKFNTRAIAIPVGHSGLECQNFDVDLKRWLISFAAVQSDNASNCSLVKGSHGLFMEAQTLKSLAEPFTRPFSLAFYVQAKLKDWKVRIMKSGRLEVLSQLYRDPHNSWKHKRTETERLHAFYRAIGVKEEILSSGVSQFYGCNKHTPRCFASIVDDMPDYLYQGRWTPPCCLKALRETVKHVFAILEKHNVRYWLEGGSLLGAVRHQDIIPWDYDVDVGIYKEDIEKCPYLNKAKEELYIDEQDFVWEKASEGDFYRVQYSDVNHLHVDLHPFYSRNGVMTKDTWFPTHRQDTEFPEKFLQPLTQIEFAGIVASAPNNVREFLEYKFGEGVIENPKYPNYQKPV